jgi:hypothetical protein
MSPALRSRGPKNALDVKLKTPVDECNRDLYEAAGAADATACSRIGSRTATTYVRIVRDFAEYFHQPPDKLGPEQFRQYQANLFQAKRDHKNFEKGVDRVIKASTDVGVTDCVRVILKETFLPMTAAEIKKAIEDRKYNLTVYRNPLAVIHTILKRLVKSDEVRVIPQPGGKKVYQWISTADKLLSEIQNSNQPVIQKHGKSTESK